MQESLAALTALTALDITDNELTEVGVAVFGRSVPGAKTFRAGFNKVYDRDVLGAALIRMPELTHVSLAGNILSGSCGMLGAYLKRLPHLEVLDLSESGLSLPDLTTLGPHIAAMPSVSVRRSPPAMHCHCTAMHRRIWRCWTCPLLPDLTTLGPYTAAMPSGSVRRSPAGHVSDFPASKVTHH